MTDTIMIFVSEKAANRGSYIFLPKPMHEIRDELDREKIYGDVTGKLLSAEKFPELLPMEFAEEPTLAELNFLVERLVEISEDTEKLYAYRALMRTPAADIYEAINRTYGLESIPVYPCKDASEYGEIVLDNAFLDEFVNLPDEIYNLLDREKVGHIMQESEGGVFMDGWYIIPSSYEPKIVYDRSNPIKEESWIFRMELAAVPENPDDISEAETVFLTLPATDEEMKNVASQLGVNRIDECVWLKFETTIPQITNDVVNSTENIYLLNEMAETISKMPRSEIVKYKAVLESESPRYLDFASSILKSLDQYEFDGSVENLSDYSVNYLAKMLPPDFDKEIIEIAGSINLGRDIAARNRAIFTEYGMVSRCGEHLYSMIEAKPSEDLMQTEKGGETMKYEVKCAAEEHKTMFYSDCSPELREACVGHLRMDFGRVGKEFYSTWWGNRPELNDKTFRNELDDVINALRKDGLLKSRSEMMKFCSENSHLPLGESRGFAVETEQHLFLFRCKPQVGDYDCYCYCYNKQELQMAQSQQQNQSSEPIMSM